MKTWEMIKELTENPSKEFIRKTDGLHIKTNKHGELIWGSGYQFIQLSHEWEEVKKPVDFIEVIRAKAKIRVEHRLLSDNFHGLGCLMRDISDFDSYDIRDIILNGKWYIED